MFLFTHKLKILSERKYALTSAQANKCKIKN